MKTKSVRDKASNAHLLNTLVLLFATLLVFSACSTTASNEAETISAAAASESSSATIAEGVPGGIIVDTMEVSATVIAIDTVNRKVTLKGPDGKESTIKVGPGAVNFDQVRVGDIVKATVTEELVVFLDEEGTAAPDGAAAMVALAPKGAQPGGVVAETMQVTATVKAIDTAHRKATLQFEDGSTGTVPVRDDIDLSQRKVGEKVVFQVTEMIAISVEKQ